MNILTSEGMVVATVPRTFTRVTGFMVTWTRTTLHVKAVKHFFHVPSLNLVAKTTSVFTIQSTLSTDAQQMRTPLRNGGLGNGSNKARIICERIIAVITVDPANKISFVYNCMHTRLRGHYNGK